MTFDWSATFPPEPSSLRRCRGDVAHALRDAGVAAAVIDDALVILAELVGNAIRHAGTDFTVTVGMRAGALRLEVFDGDTRPPAVVGLDAESTSGRGLHIVAGLASSWGWEPAGNETGVSGKRVWAELASPGLSADDSG